MDDDGRQTMVHWHTYCSLGLMVSEKKIFFFLYKCMGANDTRGMASLA